VRDAGNTVYGVGKISDIFAGCDIDDSFPTKSNVDGINRTIELLENVDEGLVFVNLVETDMLWGHRNDPVNFHRCLQDFDRRLPDILEALRSGDLWSSRRTTAAIPRPSRRTIRANTRSCSPTRRAATPAGRVHEEGEFADVGATVNAWLAGKSPGKRLPGRQIEL
jgi:phosphopentomutase